MEDAMKTPVTSPADSANSRPIDKIPEISLDDMIAKGTIHGTDGVHADTRQRDPSFIMTGHHCHSCYELYYVESGECRFLVDDRIFDLCAGDFIILPPMVLHYTRYVFGPCRRTVILFRAEDVPAEVRQFMPNPDRFFSEPSIFQVPEAYRSQTVGALQHMCMEEKIRDSRSVLLQQLYLQGLFLLCGRVCTFLAEPPVDIHTTDRQVLQAARFISRYYMNPITTADVARAVSFSPNYLSRKFRTSAGIGLHEYLVFIRLHHAAQELISTRDTITTIALRCGFSDSNYFKDSFKKRYGVTPRVFRKMEVG